LHFRANIGFDTERITSFDHGIAGADSAESDETPTARRPELALALALLLNHSPLQTQQVEHDMAKGWIRR
jgi:hypothetical protein